MGPGPWTEGEDREGEASERTTMLSSRSGIERERVRKVRGKSSSKQTTAVGRSGSYDTRMLNPCWIAFLDRLLIAAVSTTSGYGINTKLCCLKQSQRNASRKGRQIGAAEQKTRRNDARCKAEKHEA